MRVAWSTITSNETLAINRWSSFCQTYRIRSHWPPRRPDVISTRNCLKKWVWLELMYCTKQRNQMALRQLVALNWIRYQLRPKKLHLIARSTLLRRKTKPIAFNTSNANSNNQIRREVISLSIILRSTMRQKRTYIKRKLALLMAMIHILTRWSREWQFARIKTSQKISPTASSSQCLSACQARVWTTCLTTISKWNRRVWT